MDENIQLTNLRGIVVNIRLSSKNLEPRRVYVIPAAFSVSRYMPPGKTVGELHLDTKSNEVFVYNGNEWISAKQKEDWTLWTQYRRNHPLA